MWDVFKEIEGLGNKLVVIWKGFGWVLGKFWIGFIEDILDVRF